MNVDELDKLIETVMPTVQLKFSRLQNVMRSRKKFDFIEFNGTLHVIPRRLFRDALLKIFPERRNNPRWKPEEI